MERKKVVGVTSADGKSMKESKKATVPFPRHLWMRWQWHTRAASSPLRSLLFQKAFSIPTKVTFSSPSFFCYMYNNTNTYTIHSVWKSPKKTHFYTFTTLRAKWALKWGKLYVLCLQNGASFGKNQLMNGFTLAKPNLRLYNYKIQQKRKKFELFSNTVTMRTEIIWSLVRNLNFILFPVFC